MKQFWKANADEILACTVAYTATLEAVKGTPVFSPLQLYYNLVTLQITDHPFFFQIRSPRYGKDQEDARTRGFGDSADDDRDFRASTFYGGSQMEVPRNKYAL